MARQVSVSLALPDETMPRTVFWERFLGALQASPRYVEDPEKADFLFPAEDLSFETNWPRFGRNASALVRGEIDHEAWSSYISKFIKLPKRLCVINMHPDFRLVTMMESLRNIVVADGSLAGWERAVNPRTISMPALPISPGVPNFDRRVVKASFRGALSHPCRRALVSLHGKDGIICQEAGGHVGQIDADAGRLDAGYAALMQASEFAFVPRGDSLFSYRFLEAVSYSAIPVVLSDGWVLPFDRIVPWAEASLHVPESLVPCLSEILDKFTEDRCQEMRLALTAAWYERFSSMEKIVEGLCLELDALYGQTQAY
jgi:hypothetical protein